MSLSALNAWTDRLVAAGRSHMALFQRRDALTALLLAGELQTINASAGDRGRPVVLHPVPEPRLWELGRRPVEIHNPASRRLRLDLGRTVNIMDGLAEAFGAGWSNSEDWGCWTGERFAWLNLTLAPTTPLPVFIDLHLKIDFPYGLKRFLVVGTSERVIAKVAFDPGDTDRLIRIAVGSDDVREGSVALVLESSSLFSPVEAGGSDTRVLGFGLKAVGLTEFHRSA